MSTNDLDIKPRIDDVEEATRAVSVAAVANGDIEGERKVRRAIEDAAQKNTHLLNDIRSTEEAVSALQSNEYRLEHATEELKSQSKVVNKATTTSELEFVRYTHRKDSRSTRWYYILTRMKQDYDTKLQEAEQVYHQSLAAQSQAEKRQHQLQQDIRAIEHENSNLEKLAAKHVEAHKAIDKLYYSIFTGPTPGFPDEDEREQSFMAAEAEHQATSRTVQAMTSANKRTQSLKLAIEKAQTEINRADYEIESAFFVADYVQIFVEKAARFVGRAMQLHTEAIAVLPKPLDSKLVLMNDRLKTHLAAARRYITTALQAVYPSRTVVSKLIQNMSSELQQAMDAQSGMARLTKQYETTAKESVKITSRVLEDARQSLHEIRQGAFEITVGFGAAAPPYHECCDRAEWYENDVYDACDRIPAPTVDESSLPPLPSYDEVVGQ